MTPRSPAWEIQAITDYKQQNEQYWKIIEKQRAIIKSLQQSVAQLKSDNEVLIKKNNELEAIKPVVEAAPGSDSTNVTHHTITEMSAKKELSHKKEGPLRPTLMAGSTLPVPPPRSPFRVNHSSSNERVHPLDCSTTNNSNQTQNLMDLPKRPPVLKLTVSNHTMLQPRPMNHADLLGRDYLISPGKQTSNHPSNPSSPRSVTSAASSSNDRPSFDSDYSSTCSTKYTHAFSASIPSPARSETTGHKHMMDYPSSPIISSKRTSDQHMDTVTGTKSKSEPSTPVKPRTPRYDSLMACGAQTSSDRNMLETTILSNLSNISVKIINSSLQLDEKGKDVYVYTISIIQKHDSAEVWRIQKTFQDLLVLDAKLKHSSPVMVANLKKLPDKNLLSKNSPAKADERKCMIEEYLQHAITLRSINMGSLCEFLSSDRIRSLPITLANDVGTKQGYLTKKGKNFGGWKTRYFSLDNSGVLKYYESKHGPFLGTISLANSQIASQMQLDSDHSTSYRHAFLILESKMNSSQSKHIFCADSDHDRDLWVACLRNYTNQGYITEDIINSSFADDGSMALDNLVVEPSSSTESARTVTSTGSSASFKKRPSIDFIYNYFQAAALNKNRHRLSSSLANPKISSSTPITDSYSSSNNETEEINEPAKKSKNQHSRKSFWVKKMFTNGTSQSDTLLASPLPHTAAYDYRQKQSFQDYEETRGPCQVFGVSLERAVSVSRVCEHYDLPAIVHRCIEYMESKDALTEEGIYRLSGSAMQVKTLKKRFNASGDAHLLEDEELHDVHAIAGLLKMWLRELPENILTEFFLGDFLKSIHLEDQKSKRSEVGRLVSSLPIANYTLLRSLCAHLIRIIENSDVNKMTLRNISIVFSATLGIPSSIFNMLLLEFDYIFWTDRCSDDDNAIDDTIENYIQQDVVPQATQYMRQDSYGEIGRSRRNSILYQDNTPKNIISLEKQLDIVLDNEYINQDEKSCSDGELEVAYFASRYNAESKNNKPLTGI